jgi:hypothetical protein
MRAFFGYGVGCPEGPVCNGDGRVRKEEHVAMPKNSPLSGVCQRPAQCRPTDPLGLAEVAALLGISVQAVCARRETCRPRVAFPEPRAKLRCGPVWTRQQIERYLTRLADAPARSFWTRADQRTYRRALYARVPATDEAGS